ncbi:MAG: putative sugar O-methyltransferase [Patescibacteria group bacterium]
MTNNKYGWDSPDKEVATNYINTCISFVNDDTLFKNFKRDPHFQKILEGNEFDVGEIALKSIDNLGKREEFVELLPLFRENEKIGNPQLLFFEGIGKVAPSTIRYANTYFEIKKLLERNVPKKIVEIGGGYGGLCKILSSVYDFQEYMLVDLPEVIELCKKYLSNFKELNGKIKFVYVSDIDNIDFSNTDLVIADSSLAECNPETQLLYTKKILSNSKYIYLVYNTLHDPKGMHNFKAVINILSNYDGTIESTLKNKTGKYAWNIRVISLKRKSPEDTSKQFIVGSHTSLFYNFRHALHTLKLFLKKLI